MLTELTKEQESVVEATAQEYLAILHRGDEVDIAAATPALEMIYGFFNEKLPDVEVCDSPESALRKAKELGVSSPSFDWCGASDAGWIAHYDAFLRIGVITDEEAKDLLKMRALLFAGVYDTILLDGRALVIRFPHTVKLDNNGDLHCADGPAIAWRDGKQEYSWHGVFVDQKLIETPEQYSKREALALPTEKRRALCERVGWEKAMELFGCELSDTWTDPKTGLKYELFRGNDLAILRKQSPVLMTGEQPHYCEPVHTELKTAQAARKWQAVTRPDSDPAATARACNKNPALEYSVEA